MVVAKKFSWLFDTLLYIERCAECHTGLHLFFQTEPFHAPMDSLHHGFSQSALQLLSNGGFLCLQGFVPTMLWCSDPVTLRQDCCKCTRLLRLKSLSVQQGPCRQSVPMLACATAASLRTRACSQKVLLETTSLVRQVAKKSLPKGNRQPSFRPILHIARCQQGNVLAGGSRVRTFTFGSLKICMCSSGCIWVVQAWDPAGDVQRGPWVVQEVVSTKHWPRPQLSFFHVFHPAQLLWFYGE